MRIRTKTNRLVIDANILRDLDSNKNRDETKDVKYHFIEISLYEQ